MKKKKSDGNKLGEDLEQLMRYSNIVVGVYICRTTLERYLSLPSKVKVLAFP